MKERTHSYGSNGLYRGTLDGIIRSLAATAARFQVMLVRYLLSRRRRSPNIIMLKSTLSSNDNIIVVTRLSYKLLLGVLVLL